MKIAVITLLIVFVYNASGQEIAKQKTLFEKVTGFEKKMDIFNLELQIHTTFNTYFSQGKLDETAFKVNQLRYKISGDINNWISYHWEQQLNVGNDPGSLDNTPESIEYAGVGFKLSPRFSLFAGKQCAAFGGIEFDQDPVEIYEYSALGDNLTSYLTGLDMACQLTDDHELRFQILNTRNGSVEDMFGELPLGVKKSKVPLGYTLNWNGTLWDGLINTRWSASVLNEAKNKYTYYYAAGTELDMDKFGMYFDFLYSREQLDSKGIISGIYNEFTEDAPCAMNVDYISYIARMNYRFLPKWNVFAKGMYEKASVYKATEDLEKGKYVTSLGYLGGVEFYPMEDNLHFFLTFVGRSYDFTSRAFADDYDTQRISLGFIYKIPVF